MAASFAQSLRGNYVAVKKKREFVKAERLKGNQRSHGAAGILSVYFIRPHLRLNPLWLHDPMTSRGMCLSAVGECRGLRGEGVRDAAPRFKLRVGGVQNNVNEYTRGTRERVAATPGRLCVFSQRRNAALCDGRLCRDVVLMAAEHFLPVVAKMEAQSSSEFTARHNNKLVPSVGVGVGEAGGAIPRPH